MTTWPYIHTVGIDPHERDARLANKALKSKKQCITQLQVIVEIACASSPHHLVAMRQAYCSLFDCSIEEDIISCVSQPVRKVIAIYMQYLFIVLTLLFNVPICIVEAIYKRNIAGAPELYLKSPSYIFLTVADIVVYCSNNSFLELDCIQ